MNLGNSGPVKASGLHSCRMHIQIPCQTHRLSQVAGSIPNGTCVPPSRATRRSGQASALPQGDAEGCPRPGDGARGAFQQGADERAEAAVRVADDELQHHCWQPGDGQLGLWGRGSGGLAQGSPEAKNLFCPSIFNSTSPCVAHVTDDTFLSKQ